MRWAWLWLLAGCLPELDGGVVIEGRHVTVHADPAIPVCEDAVANADRFVEDTSAMLGVEPPHIDYYLFDGPTGCGYGQYATASCAINGAVFANVWIHYHELVHAVDDSHPPALFVEGLAEALSIPSSVARNTSLSRKDAEVPFESTRFRAGEPATNYQVAGDFVRYLLDRFGMVRYRRFAHSLVSLADQITIRRAFREAFDATLDDVIADWRRTDPRDSALSVPVDLAECHDVITPISDETWGADHVEPSSCATGTTSRGSYYAQPQHRYGFEVSEPGLFLVHAGGGEGARCALRSCVAGRRDEYSMSGDVQGFVATPLVAGRHAIELLDGVERWRVSRLGDVGSSCETAPSFTAPAGEAWRLELRGEPATWLRVDYEGDRPVYAYTRLTSPTRMCVGGCAPSQCKPLAHQIVVERLAGQPLYIELGPRTDAAPLVIVGVDPTP